MIDGRFMRAVPAAVIGFVIWMPSTDTATFGGFECNVDCSGHKAGYEWAETKGITDKAQCDEILISSPNRTSFYEGCLVARSGRRSPAPLTYAVGCSEPRQVLAVRGGPEFPRRACTPACGA
jgi:hypothetical protein